MVLFKFINGLINYKAKNSNLKLKSIPQPYKTWANMLQIKKDGMILIFFHREKNVV